MSNTSQERWQQRFENFRRSLNQLELACKKDNYSTLERAGLVQLFKISFELAWKTMQDLLFYEGYDEKNPRDTIKKSFVAGYLTEDQTQTLLDALDKRNLLAHTYNEELAEKSTALIKNNYFPALMGLVLTLKQKK